MEFRVQNRHDAFSPVKVRVAAELHMIDSDFEARSRAERDANELARDANPAGDPRNSDTAQHRHPRGCQRSPCGTEGDLSGDCNL